MNVDVVDNRQHKPGEWPAMYVGDTASGAVLTALFGIEGYSGNHAERDEDLDPDSYDPSYLAATAHAGGLGDDNGSAANSGCGTSEMQSPG